MSHGPAPDWIKNRSAAPLIVKSRVLEGDEKERYTRKKGLCHNCGLYKTHHVKRGLLREPILDPIEKVTNKNGTITVYKGYCIQPTCYTLDEAKELLGEISKRNRKRPHKKSALNSTATLNSGEVDSIDNNSGRYSTGAGSGAYFGGSGNGSGTFQGGGSSGQLYMSDTSENSTYLIQDNLGATTTRPRRRTAGPGTDFGLRPVGTAERRRTDFHQYGNQSINLLEPHVEFHTPNRYGSNNSNTGSHNSNSRNNGHHDSFGRSSFKSHSGQESITLASLDASEEKQEETEESPTEKTSRMLTDYAETDDYIHFLALLESNKSKKVLVQMAFDLLCKSIPEAHRKRKRASVFQSDGWVKSLTSVGREHDNDVEIQQLLVRLLMALCAISKQYMADILRLGGTQFILDVMNRFDENSDCLDVCCGVFFSFSTIASERNALSTDNATKMVKAILPSLKHASANGKTWGIAALLNLSKQKKPRGLPALVRQGGGSNILLEATWSHLRDGEVVDVGLEMLWTLSFEQDEEKNNFIECSDKLVAIIASIVKWQDAPSNAVMSAFGLVSNLSSQTSNMEALCGLWKSDFVEATAKKMKENDENLEFQTNALNMIYCLTHEGRHDKTSNTGILVQAVLTVIEAHLQVICLQSLGCTVLSCLCRFDNEMKSKMLKLGGHELLSRAAEYHASGSKNHETETERDQSEQFEVAICTIVAVLSTDPEIRNALGETSLASECVDLVQSSNSSQLPAPVQNNILGLAYGTNDAANGTSTSAFIASLVNPATVSRAESSISKLYAIVRSTPTARDALIASNGGKGMAQIVDLMNRYQSSDIVLENACSIFVSIYSAYPFEGVIPRTKDVQIGSDDTDTVEAVTHSETEIAALRQVLRSHRGNPVIVKNAVLALTKILHDVTSLDLDRDAAAKVKRLFDGCFKDCNDILAVEQNEEIQSCALGMAQLLCGLNDQVQIRRWCPLLLNNIINLSLKTENTPLQRDAFAAALALALTADDDDTISVLDSSDSIESLLPALSSETEELSELASRLLECLAKRLVTVPPRIVDKPGALDAIIGTIFSSQSKPIIVSSCCSLLSSIAVVGDSYIKRTIASSGGVSAILEAMATLKDNEGVQANGCRALSEIARGMTNDLVLDLKDNLCRGLSNVLQIHVSSEKAMTAALEMIWGLCSREPVFKQFFGGREQVSRMVQAMDMHIGNRFIQSAGCTALWSLSSDRVNKDTIGECGGLMSIINALMVHIDASSLQREGLTALKNLATTSYNKQRIQRYGGEDAILYSMMFNLQREEVIASAFSALNNIAVDRQTNRVSSVSDRVLDCILEAMFRFPQSGVVQRNGCFLIKSYTFSPANVELMMEYSSEIVSLVVAASDAFPEECGQRADDILRRLEFR